MGDTPPDHTNTHVTLARGEGPRGTEWVQVPRRSLEAMSMLISESAAAATVLIALTGRMGPNNAIVASVGTIMELTGLSESSVHRALGILKKRRWIRRIRIGKTKSVTAIVINSQVAWVGRTKGKRHSLFHASVLVSESEQTEMDHLTNDEPLYEVPAVYRGEAQLPTGDGLPPPSQPSLTGLEPDLPARQIDIEDYDPETGEIR